MSVDVQVETTIERPLAVVAAFAIDPTKAPGVVRQHPVGGVEDAAPIAVGSQMDFVAQFLGRRLAYTYEVIELEPERRLVMRTADGPFPMETTYVWEPTAEGATRMTLRNRGNPSALYRFAAPVMERAMRRANTKDLARLKAMLETGGRRR